MCGRFALFATENEIVSHFGLRHGFMMRPKYNISPGQTIPTIFALGAQIEFCHWTFIPPWAKSEDEKFPKGYFNARIETISEKRTFKDAFLKRRCLIPASGYYEWAMLKNKKQPYFFKPEQDPIMAFAGIWSKWASPKGEVLSCAILTQPAYGNRQKIHERMPVIISPKDYCAYLNLKTDPLSIFEFVQNNPAQLDFYPVSSVVNNARFEGAECINRI